MKVHQTVIFLSMSLLIAAAVALYTVFQAKPPTRLATQALQKRSSVQHPHGQQSPILWRMPISATVNKPTPLPCGWLVTDSNGHILSLTGKGSIQWQASYSNYAWQASTVVDDETICAVTQNGQLVLIDAATGVFKWSTETGTRCLHPPLVEMLDQQCIIILLSQEDGILTCINARDGSLRWRSPSTNRSDGPPVRSGDAIAYGNCDAAVHLFSITNGQLIGSIQLADDEQVAGAVLPLPNGKLIVGTQRGTLALLDLARMTCISRISASDTEAFATPILISTNRIFMPVSEGRMTFLRIEGDKLVAEKTLQLASRFDEMVVVDTIFWAIANRSVYAVRLAAPTEHMHFNVGDDLCKIAPGCFGKTVLIADGELICVKGF